MGLTKTVDRAVSTAFRALGKIARPATFQSHTGNIARDLAQGTDVTEVVEFRLPRVAFVRFSEEEIDGQAVEVSDQRVLFPSGDLPIEPKNGDTIIDCRGAQWRIVKRFDGPGAPIVRAQVRPSNVATSLSVTAKRYCGVSTEPTLDSAGILALGNSEVASDLEKTVKYDATGGRYLYYAYPAALGPLTNVTVAGLFFSDYAVTVVPFTDEGGNTENYIVVRIRNLQTGSAIPVTWA
jgi:hypothetical protein